MKLRGVCYGRKWLSAWRNLRERPLEPVQKVYRERPFVVPWAQGGSWKRVPVWRKRHGLVRMSHEEVAECHEWFGWETNGSGATDYHLDGDCANARRGCVHDHIYSHGVASSVF
jgi:hypothetical protein